MIPGLPKRNPGLEFANAFSVRTKRSNACQPRAFQEPSTNELRKTSLLGDGNFVGGDVEWAILHRPLIWSQQLQAHGVLSRFPAGQPDRLPLVDVTSFVIIDEIANPILAAIAFKVGVAEQEIDHDR